MWNIRQQYLVDMTAWNFEQNFDVLYRYNSIQIISLFTFPFQSLWSSKVHIEFFVNKAYDSLLKLKKSQSNALFTNHFVKLFMSMKFWTSQRSLDSEWSLRHLQQGSYRVWGECAHTLKVILHFLWEKFHLRSDYLCRSWAGCSRLNLTFRSKHKCSIEVKTF